MIVYATNHSEQIHRVQGTQTRQNPITPRSRSRISSLVRGLKIEGQEGPMAARVGREGESGVIGRMDNRLRRNCVSVSADIIDGS